MAGIATNGSTNGVWGSQNLEPSAVYGYGAETSFGKKTESGTQIESNPASSAVFAIGNS
jgi:hypothetical protein